MAIAAQASSSQAMHTLSRRRSQRLTSTGKTSSYFEDDASDVDEAPERPRKISKTKATSRPKRSSIPNGNSKYHRNTTASSNSVDDEDFHTASEGGFDDDDNDDDNNNEDDEFDDDSIDGRRAVKKQTPNSKKRGRPPASGKQAKVIKVERKTKQDEDGDEEDDEDEDDEESRFTFIPLPKLRDTGDVDYEPERIHPNTLLFLGDLKANNKRSWLKLHDEEYRRSLKDWESFVETITEKITEADETVPELPLKDVIFRIYRDVRFSKDPTPYKPHYSAAWSRTGRKGPYACYYVHVEPGRCLVGGGLWCPDKDALARLRASIDERPHRIRRVLMNPTFRKTFLPKAVESNSANKKKTATGKGKTANSGHVDEAAAAVRAFAAANRENALKTKPKGFDSDHRDIELLKLKNFTVSKKFSDQDFTAPDSQERIMDAIHAMVEFVTFLNSVVMPDPGDDSDSDEEEAEEQQEDEREDDEDDDEE